MTYNILDSAHKNFDFKDPIFLREVDLSIQFSIKLLINFISIVKIAGFVAKKNLASQNFATAILPS